MKEKDIDKTIEQLKELSNRFEDKPWTGVVKLLRENFRKEKFKDPIYYEDALNNLGELYRQARVMYIISVFDKLCQEEHKFYEFDEPYQAGMSYDGVIKKDGLFYLRDEDGDLREIFSSENFARFVEEEFWELYEDSE